MVFQIEVQFRPHVLQDERVLAALPLILILAADPPADRTAVVGAGFAMERESGAVGVGGAAFVEYEVKPETLELELGAQVVGRNAQADYSLDFLFKWPRQLRPQLEIMVGAGPTLAIAEGRVRWGVEAAVDLMWWPTSQVGLSIEPSGDILFRDGRSVGVAVTAGPIIGW